MAQIQLKNIVKVYGDGFAAVDDVSIDIDDGEFVILVGPSGSGKSTLLRMIAGLEDITSGDLTIGGTRVNEKAPRDRGLAMVFQNYALYPHLTVYENIAFPLRLAKHRMKDADVDAAVRNAAGLLELEEHLERKPANLSGGQRQRVAMGRALVREANAFLFDEPLSNLDAKLRGQMRTEIARLQRRLGTTTVYVTHDQTEAMTLGDRVAVLRRGVLQQVASPRELYEQPVNLFVAGFIGSPPMNFVPGRVDGGTLHLPFGDLPLPEDMVAAVGDREVVVAGVRPEHFEDASLVDDDREGGVTFEADVDVTEWLGDELYAYVPFEAEGEVRQKLEDLDRELDGEGMRTQLVVALDGQSRVRDGSRARLWLDTTRMHLFDPETGENLTRDEEKAAQLGKESADARREALEREKQHRDAAASDGGRPRTVDVRDQGQRTGARA
ncbi:sn-glycerol-3-phosphate ABC transporter ATP-binding protein UgpC [Aquipuribacter nitratireducens]|uniref:ABC transporter ATP-binding protein n=1 Tax=Aquipuribacter nitratireducens TaxID=650104 RepID=A0ABW0GM44_9MICO